MCDDRGTGSAQVVVRVAPSELGGLLHAQPRGHVAVQRVVRGRLVGDEVEGLSAPRELRHDFRRIPEEADRQSAALRRRSPHPRQRLVKRSRRLVQVARLETPLDARRIDLDAEASRTGHRGGERLRAAHAAQASGQNRPSREVGGAEVLLPGGCERLVRALEDSLRADIDPAPGGHLAEHRQTLGLEPPELLPGRPLGDEQRVRDQDARRSGVRAEHSDRLSALHEQRLVFTE